MELELKEYAQIVKKKLWLILFIVILVGSTTGIYSYLFVQPKYEASNKLIITSGEKDQKTGIQKNDVDMGILLVDTYKEMLSTTAVLEKVVDRYPDLNLTVDALLENMKVETVADTPVLIVSVREYSYSSASQVADAVSNVFKSEVPRIIQAGSLTILKERSNNPSPVTPSPLMYTIIAVVVSLILGIGLAFLIEYLDDSIKSEEDVTQLLGLTTLAVIRNMKASDLRDKRSVSSKLQKLRETGTVIQQ
ncbi:YveK family protein [Paenibacillus xylanilyticus]|uniref:Lipopolysaccharide biosynthesis protein n=1 Tax=Paenibacillus xylanilyticus TaxID=248903 RepID=A0A7Y6BUZ3_9BACL|nr:Wzz/FepE/Etk N-terminal domain-containing protein [Paenibacillus xylanilyticus]NUU75291.1 lipopolysaccharide biosynthesis protein [Paenibacillus xylanilyticus]